MGVALTMMFALALASGCGDGSGSGGGGLDYVSHDPTFEDAWQDLSSVTVTTGGSGTSGAGGGNGAAPIDEANRALEADVIEVVGDRIYALGSTTGLTVIDAADPDHLVVLGRRHMGGVSDELYVVGDVVYVLFHEGLNTYDYVGPPDPASGQSVHVEALDVSDPAAIETRGAVTIQGWLVASRRTDDVLYVVADDAGSPTYGTTVTSLDLTTGASLAVIDQVNLSDAGFPPYTTTVLATPERLYVAGVVDADTSTAQVVDISDPAGTLGVGAALTISGRLRSRWQWDEYAGVLRVITQPEDIAASPRVQTFSVVSSDEVTPLGAIDIVLPVPEDLRTVRFDGPRAYAVTVEVLDPLYVIDLSDPAAPMVRGSVTLPGFIHHIEPRGDELVALGVDPVDPEGVLNLSLFDVADLDAPALVSKVSFGPGLASFGDDVDNIRDAFQILPAIGLIAVPFHAEGFISSCPTYENGVQLVDWSTGQLVKRGVAPGSGLTRRALVHRGHLLAMSDDEVRAFDVSDRDAPASTSAVELTTVAVNARAAASAVVRVTNTWKQEWPRVETVPLDDPARDQPIGSLNLEPWLAATEQVWECFGAFAAPRVFTHYTFAYLVFHDFTVGRARVLAVDVTDPASPVVRGQVDVGMSDAMFGYGTMLVAGGQPVVQVGSRLVFQWIEGGENFSSGYYRNVGVPVHGGSLTVVDFSDPASPQAQSFALPLGVGHTGLLVAGEDVVFSHWEPTSVPKEARFFLDRLVPGAAELADPINMPGSLVAYDATSDHALTSDYQGVTGAVDRTLEVVAVDRVRSRATVLDRAPLSLDQKVTYLSAGDERAFFAVAGPGFYGLDVVGGFREGAIETASVDVPVAAFNSSFVVVEGQTATVASLTSSLFTVDASDMSAVVATKLADLSWWAQDLSVSDGRAIVAVGFYGVESVELP